MDRYGTRAGAAFGWIALIGVVLGLIVIPMVVAGQPPTLATSADVARAYFSHGELLIIYVVSPLIAVFMLPFGLALRNALRIGSDQARVAADVGLLVLVVTAPMYVAASALGAVLTGEASGDPTVFEALFRVRFLVYDSAADFLEGAWIGAFALATLAGPRQRWLGALGVAVALTRWLKGLAPVMVIPDALIMVGGIAFFVWWAWTIIWLARHPAPTPTA